jgi:transposase
MMGRREGRQGQFFYSFNLDQVVPADRLVRQIDGVLDLAWVHKELAPYYSHTGRPSIDPALMIRMLIVGYVFAIRSERRLCAEVQVNLAYRWFCKLGIEDKIPDHSVFCRARHERFRESDALRRVFEGVVAMCIASGLVGGEAFSVDASLIKADVDKKKRIPGEQPISWPKSQEASRAVREYLAALDTADSDEKNGGGDVGGSSGSGSRSKPAKEVSLTDPQAAWVARRGVDPFFAYDANYLIDNKAGIILDAEGTRANRIAEIAVTQTMVERVRRRFNLQPQRLAGDTVYGRSGCSSGWWIATSHRTFQCGTGQRDPMAASAEPTLSSTGSATFMFAPVAQRSPVPATSIRATSSTTGPTRTTARSAR